MNTRVASIYSISDMFTDTLDAGGSVKLPVKGVSMYPLFRPDRDYAVISKATHYKKYDIVFYMRQDGSYVLHRIVGKGKDGFILAGDSEVSKETGVSESQILAKTSYIIRNNRQIDVKGFWYGMYSRVWVALMPLRHCIIDLWLRNRKFFK